MTIVFVHGVPEIADVWDPLGGKLSGLGFTCQVRLSPPGFGAPVPTGWECTVGDYAGWLIAELEKFDSPVDLVGHDWGGGHVVNVAMRRPDLLRSWVSDAVGIFDVEYVWHEAARIWQAPGEGEAFIARWLAATPSDRAAGFTNAVEPAIATRLAAALDATMGESILALYRSAAQPVMARLGDYLERAAARPGLAILPTEDPYVGTMDQRLRAARRAGCQVDVLDGSGHWWLAEAGNDRAVQTLAEFWNSL